MCLTAKSRTITNNAEVLNKAKEMMDKIKNREHRNDYSHHHHSNNSDRSEHHHNSQNSSSSRKENSATMAMFGQYASNSSGPNKSRSVNWLEGDRPRPEPDPHTELQRQQLIEQIARKMAQEAEEAEEQSAGKVINTSSGDSKSSVADPLQAIPIPKPTPAASIPIPPQKPGTRGPRYAGPGRQSCVFIKNINS